MISFIGRTLGPYRIVGLLGQGAMGTVYRADDVDTGAQVALKTVSPTSREHFGALRAEAAALASVSHPAIVRLISTGSTDTVPWYAMELVEGPSLRDVWRGYRSDPGDRRAAAGNLDEVLTVVSRLAAGLVALHAKGLVHRDLKPENVVLRPNGHPVIIDLGCVAHAGGSLGRERVAIHGRAVGTLAYMAPEQAAGRPVDARADLYALGAMLYEAVTGRPTLQVLDLAEALAEIQTRPPDDPTTLVDGLPAGLASLLRRLLAKDRRQRIGHAEDVVAALAELGAPREDPPEAPNAPVYLYRPDLAGREVALATTASVFDDLREGRGSLVCIVGESGIGKTALASEVAGLAAIRRFTVVTGECLPGGSPGVGVAAPAGAPLFPLARLLQLVVDRSLELGPGVTATLLGERAGVLARFEPAMVPLLTGPTRVVDDLLPGVARRRVLDALSQTVAAVARQEGGLLLVLDDLQWADDLTLAWLSSLPPAWFAATPIVITTTWRSEESRPELAALAERPESVRLPVGRLREREVGTIVSDMLAVESPPAEFLRFVVAQSEGNPFFVAEYLRMAVQEGHVRRWDGRWQFVVNDGPAAPLPLSRTLAELVHHRILALPPAARELGRLAAVIGRSAPRELFYAASNASEEEVDSALQALAERQVVETTDDGGWRFLHHKLHEALYADIAAAGLERLHRRVASALDALWEVDGTPPEPARIARHWRAAGEIELAVRAFESAAALAQARYDAAGAIESFRALLDLGPPGSDPASRLLRGRWHSGIMAAEFATGRRPHGRQSAEAALASFGHPMPTRPWQWTLALGTALFDRGWVAAVPWAAQLTDPLEADAARESAYVYQRMLEPLAWSNHPTWGIVAGLRCVNLAQRVAPTPALARGLAFLSTVLATTPLRGLADRWATRAMALASEIGSPELRAYVCNRTGVGDIAGARWSTAFARLDESLAIAESLGDVRWADDTRTCRGLARLWTGDLTGALRDAEATLASAGARSDLQAVQWGRSNAIAALLRLGREADAARLSARQRPFDATLDTTFIGGNTARLYWQTGREAEAAELARGVVGVYERVRPFPYFHHVPLLNAAEVLLLRWESGAGEPGPARTAVRLLGRYAKMHPFAAPTWGWAAGMQAWLEGRPRLAGARWEAALDAARRRAMPYESATLELELGMRCRDDAPARLARAEATASAIGAEPLLRRVRGATR